MTNDLHIEQLAKSYGPEAPVLRGLDLDVPGGALAAVLGPSGCGKTTLLRIVAGFLRADAGSVTVGGRQSTGPGVHLPPERRRIGIVPQEGALFPHLSVARNVAFGLTGLDRAERRRRTEEMLDLVGLAGYGDRIPHELSGGQQQRIALARALAPRPQLVLLDEPCNALDSALRAGPGAPQIEQHQLPVRGESAQVAQVGGGPHRSAGQDDEGFARTPQVVGDLGSVGGGEERHGASWSTRRAHRNGVVPRGRPSIALRGRATRRKYGPPSCLIYHRLNY